MIRRGLHYSLFALVALLLFAIIVCVAVSAPHKAPHDPADVELLSRLRLAGFQDQDGSQLLLGTDTLGRDMVSRLTYGTRISFLVGMTTVAISGLLGVALGLASGYYRDPLDAAIMRLADIELAFLNILLYIAVLVVLGPGLEKVVSMGWIIR